MVANYDEKASFLLLKSIAHERGDARVSERTGLAHQATRLERENIHSLLLRHLAAGRATRVAVLAVTRIPLGLEGPKNFLELPFAQKVLPGGVGELSQD
jgi:hypothetical protein